MLNGWIGLGARVKPVATLELAIQTTKVRPGAAEFTNATGQVKVAARGAASEVGVLNKSLDSVGITAASVSRAVAGLFGVFSALQGVREAVKTFAEFELTMASVKGVLEATEQQMYKLNKAVLSVAASSKSSSVEAASGLLTLAKAGFSVQESIDALPASIALAVAHNLDLGTATDNLSASLRQFRLEATQASRVVDVLSNTANKSLADVKDLAEALKYAGPVAGALGISIEETAAAIGVLSDRAIKGSLAGTNVRGILTDLINPTAKAKQALAELGLTVRDVDVKTVGFTGALKNLAKAGANTQDIVRLFGVMQTSGGTALVQSIKALERLTESNKAATGSTQKLLEIMRDTLSGRFKEFINILGVASVQLGQSGLGKSIKDLLVIITDAIRLMTGFGDEIVGSKDRAEKLAGAFKVAGLALGGILALNVAGWLIGVSKAIALAMFATTGWNKQLVISASILSGLMAFDFGGYLYREFKSIRQFGNDLAVAIQTAASEIEYYWDYLVIHMKDAWSGFVNWVAQQTSKLVGPISSILNGIAPGSGLAILSLANVGGTNYDMNTELEAANSRRQTRQNDISAGYLAQINEANSDFKTKNRLTGDSYWDQLGQSLDGTTTGLLSQIEAWTKLTKSVGTTEESVEGTTHAFDEYIDRARDVTILNEEAHTRVLQMTQSLSDEAAALSQSQRERNVLVKVTQFQTVAEEAYGKGTERTTEAIKAYTKAVNDLEDARADKKFGERIRQIQDERLALALTTNERRVAVQTAQFQAEAEEAYGKQSAKSIEMTALYRKELEKLVETEELRQLADNIGDEFGKAFTDIVFGAKSAEDAIESLTRAIIQMVFQQLVAKQISGIIGSGVTYAFAASGNAYNQGNIVPFAKGGVVSNPTMFPLSSGRTGLMGEAGPEAVMPLSRTGSGKLGVEVVGHASKTINVNMQVVSADPNEFRASERQIATGLRHRMSRL